MNNKYKKSWALLILCPPLIFLAVALIVMWLWNCILPEVVGVKSINYWQAMGILVLSKILFGGFRGGARKKWMDCKEEHLNKKTENFSDDEKEQFKQKLKERFANSPWCRKD